MICGMEIGLAIFGILALVRGKMTLSKNKIVIGAPARLLGLVALAPLPLAFGAGVLFAITQGAEANAERFAEDNRWTLTLIEAGIVIGTAIVVFLIGAMVAVSPAEAERRERGVRDDDYGDRDDRGDDRDDRRDEQDERDRKPWK